MGMFGLFSEETGEKYTSSHPSRSEGKREFEVGIASFKTAVKRQSISAGNYSKVSILRRCRIIRRPFKEGFALSSSTHLAPRPDDHLNLGVYGM